MRSTKEFLLFIFRPLFFKGRWFLWVLLVLLLMMMGSTITALRMEIPTVDNVSRISGKFIDTSKGYSRTGLFGIEIVDESGITHQCSCEPLGYSNCLGRSPSDHPEIRGQLDQVLLKKYSMHKAILKWLDGRQGEVWMYPNRSLFGIQNSCYQISSDAYVLRSFEQSVHEYVYAKRGVHIYLFWFIVLSGAVFLSIYLISRITAFFKEGDF